MRDSLNSFWRHILFYITFTLLPLSAIGASDPVPEISSSGQEVAVKMPSVDVDSDAGTSGIPFIVENDRGRFNLAPYLYSFEDSEDIYDISTISDPVLNQRFLRNNQNVLSFGYVDAVYWLRVEIANKTESRPGWLLELTGMGRSIDQVQIFIQENDGFTSYISGDAVPFSMRPIKHHAVLFPLSIPRGESVTVYFRVSTNGTLQIPMVLWSESAFSEQEHNNILLDGLFYGIIFIMAMYNAFIFLSLRDLSYGYYVFYLLCVAFFAASLRGIGFEYFWPEQPWWNNKSNLVFAELTVMFIVLFAQSFLHTKENLPTLHKLMNILLVTVLPGLYCVLYAGHLISASLLSLQFLFAIGLVLTTAIIESQKGFKAAWLYLLAWFGMLIMIVLWILNNFHILSSYFLGAYAIQTGAVIQVLMFSFALAERINLMERQREQALQQKLIETQKLTALTHTFERFVPRQFLTRIADKGLQNIELGKAETDIITIMFSDIRDFTHLSEGMSPQELLNFLNAYFNRMDRPIHQSGGFIDKFVGDAILAIFESNHYEEEANNAVTAAIKMQQAVKKYNEDRAKCGYMPIDIGVGINTGPVIIGTVGTQDRMDTTVLGDVVNLASRLEKLTKKYHVKIICSSYTLDLIDSASGILYRELDYVKVRGKQKAVRVYEIFNADEDNVRILKQRLLLDYQRGLSLYYQREWAAAIECFQACLEIFPGDMPSTLYLNRCENYLQAPPAQDWDFSWKLED